MKLSDAVQEYVQDMWAQGRFRSKQTEVSYRAALNVLAEQVANRDPSTINRNDIKRTLAHWKHPNSYRTNHSILRAFFRWTMVEGIRKDNPAEQVERARKVPPLIYRLTVEEVSGMLRACRTRREKRAIYLGFGCGLRNAELRGLQGRHFQREGFVHLSHDIAKGSRERWVPIPPECQEVVAEIRRTTALDDFILPAQRLADPPRNQAKRDYRKRRSSSQALRKLVMDVAKRAGIAAHVHPHLMRHAYGGAMVRLAGIYNARALMGHAGIETTEIYAGEPTPEELAAVVRGFGFMPKTERTFSPLGQQPAIPDEVMVGTEHRLLSFHGLEPKIALYAAHFRRLRDAV